MQFKPEEIHNLDVELKVGILATVNQEGLPHMTMLSTLRPYSETGIAFGQFTEGVSKEYVLINPKTGFLIMSLDRYVWRGKSLFTHTAKSGYEFENYNHLPMFRYNAYFGVHTVYYLDLVALIGKEKLPMGIIAFAAIKTAIARIFRGKQEDKIINHWVRKLFNKIGNLKFLCYIDQDGFPVILPVIQAQILDNKSVVFSMSAYKDDMYRIPVNVQMAVFVLSFSMEDALLRGNFTGIQRIRGVNCGIIEVDWVYNSMPPVPQQIYPPLDIKTITEF